MVSRIAVITGGARGQGASHALKFAENGHVVYALDILEDAAAELLATARERGVDIRFRKHDVTNDADWAALASHLATEHGKVDVLVNNAGITRVGGVAEETRDGFERTMAINATGQFLGMSALWSLLAASGSASVVNIASIFGSVSQNGFIAYTASKAAVIGMTKSAAIEGAKLNIRVNAVSPGVVYTPMLEEEGELLAASGRSFTPGGTPLDRGAQPQEITELVYFLGTAASSFITGSDMTIDGGFTAK